MKKNEIFTFTAPNGVEVTAIVINRVAYEVDYKEAVEKYLCYTQNRLFIYEESYSIWREDTPHKFKYGEILVDYCILPDYDAMLVMANFDKEEADILFERNNHAQEVNRVKAMGYSEKADCEI